MKSIKLYFTMVGFVILILGLIVGCAYLIVAIEMLMDYNGLLGFIVAITLIILLIALILTIGINNNVKNQRFRHCSPGKPIKAPKRPKYKE